MSSVLIPPKPPTVRRVATSALVPRRRHPRLSPPPFGLVAALVLIALFGMAVAPEPPTSPLKKRVWGFADPLSGRLSPWPDAAHGTATGYDQLAEKTASGRADTKDEDPTGLLNEGFRYRDLDSGEFITRDLAGFIDGPNVYTYVNQNPWTKFDVQGLFAVPPQGLVHATPEQRATFNRIANNTIAGVAVTAAVGLTGGAALPELVAGSAGRIGLSAVANGAGGAAAQASNNVQTGQPVGTNVPQRGHWGGTGVASLHFTFFAR